MCFALQRFNGNRQEKQQLLHNRQVFCDFPLMISCVFFAAKYLVTNLFNKMLSITQCWLCGKKIGNMAH